MSANQFAIFGASEIILFGTIGMFVLSLGVVFFFLVYQRRLLKQQKEHQAKETEYQQQLMRANLLSQEKERNRIGKDLHDSVGAMLTTAKLYFRHIDKDSTAEKFNELKEKALELLDETMVSVRRVSHDLRPIVLERLGLVEAISNAVTQVNQSNEMVIDFSHNVDQEIDKEYQLNWYRIVQELINNTLKHAQADHVDVSISTDQNRLVLKYSDNGEGIKGKNITIGLGLQNIESRLNLMNGELKLQEKSENGIEMLLTSDVKP